MVYNFQIAVSIQSVFQRRLKKLAKHSANLLYLLWAAECMDFLLFSCFFFLKSWSNKLKSDIAKTKKLKACTVAAYKVRKTPKNTNVPGYIKQKKYTTHVFSSAYTHQRPLWIHFPPFEQLISSLVNLTNPLGTHYRLYEKQLHYPSPSTEKEHHK